MVDTATREDGLHQALDQLTAVVDATESLSIGNTIVEEDTARVILEVDTTIYPRSPEGLSVRPRELVTIQFNGHFPWIPPTAFVMHGRWAGFPHVLQGIQLCLYLDPATQWQPESGMAGYIERLSGWFEEAIAGEFDPRTALYHPVGGVLHRTPGAPTIVVGDPFPFGDDLLHFQRVLLRRLSPHRVDLVAWRRDRRVNHTHIGLLVVLPKMLPFGAGSLLSDLTDIVGLQQSNGARKKLLRKLRQTSDALNPSDPLQIVIAVPNPANDGQGRFHLIAGHVDSGDINESLTAAAQRGLGKSPPPDEPEMSWLYVDDLRPGVSVRRDSDQPSQHLRGRSVELWGCGALGSWMAELLVRAGVAQITLRDPGYVTRGLLVRQNFTELDVGRPKAEALADRLRQVDGGVDVRPVVGICQPAISESPSCDLVVDATASTGVATAIETAQVSGQLRVPLVQVAADTETATLSILTVRHPQSGYTTNDIDQALHIRAKSDPDLAPCLDFWDQTAAPPLTPTLGCSVPTFRGSGADLAAIACTAVNLASLALGRSLSGGYLFASPHSPHGVPPLTAIAISDAPEPIDDESPRQQADSRSASENVPPAAIQAVLDTSSGTDGREPSQVKQDI